MTDTAYFVWEKDFAGRYTPAVYYGKPEKKMEYRIEMTSPIEVPGDCLDMDGSPRFSELQRRFPAPQVKIDDEAS